MAPRIIKSVYKLTLGKIKKTTCLIGLPCDRACNSNITADHFLQRARLKTIEL